MKTKYGLPVVSADNIWQVVSDLGITRWSRIEPPIDLNEYRKRKLTPEQCEEVNCFAPKNEVVFLEDPKGNTFRGFRSVAKNWATVFTLLPNDLIPITAEYKHGAEAICLVSPSGVPSRKDFGHQNPMAECAKREFQDETGIKLAEVVLLSGPEGNAVSSRQTTQRYFPYLGIPRIPIELRKQKLDKNEWLRVLLVPLEEWLELIKRNQIVDECAITITFLALWQLGRLRIV